MPTHLTATEAADAEPPQGTGEPCAQGDPVDLSRLYAMAGDSPVEAREIAQMYLAESEETMNGLREAIHLGSTAETERLAHKLGGCSATCGMVAIVAPLLELEISSRAAASTTESEEIFGEAGRQQARIAAYLWQHILQVNQGNPGS